MHYADDAEEQNGVGNNTYFLIMLYAVELIWEYRNSMIQ